MRNGCVFCRGERQSSVSIRGRCKPQTLYHRVARDCTPSVLVATLLRHVVWLFLRLLKILGEMPLQICCIRVCARKMREALSPQQRASLMAVKQSLAVQPIGHGVCISCIDMDRDPHRRLGHTTKHDGLVGTWRTQNELVWLYQANEQNSTVLSRRLHPGERFVLQGFRLEVAAFFSKCDRMRMPGNAFSVLVVTHAFRQALECFMTPTALGFPGAPRRVLRSRDPKEATEILYRAGLLNLERSSLAILQRQLVLHGRRM